MTTIVAVENSDHVLIGCDSQATMGRMKQSLPGGKIFTNGEYTIAVAGRFRLLQLMAKVELPPTTSDSLDYHMAHVFSPAVAEQINAISPDLLSESLMLVVVKRQVFLITPDGSAIQNNRGHYSIGSGSDYALGSLARYTGDITERQVLAALEAASNYDIGTSGPFHVSRV